MVLETCLISLNTALVMVLRSTGLDPSKTYKTLTIGSPKVLVTLHSLETNLGADLYFEVKLAGVLMKVIEGSMQLRTFSLLSVVRKLKK